jgi:hypothetical protein
VQTKSCRAAAGARGGRETVHPAGRIGRAARGPQSPQLRPRARPLGRIVSELRAWLRSPRQGGGHARAHDCAMQNGQRRSPPPGGEPPSWADRVRCPWAAEPAAAPARAPATASRALARVASRWCRLSQGGAILLAAAHCLHRHEVVRTHLTTPTYTFGNF